MKISEVLKESSYKNTTIFINKSVVKNFPKALKESVTIRPDFPICAIPVDSQEKYLSIALLLEGQTFTISDGKDRYIVEGDIAKKIPN